jgi:transcriptional regulator with XRE-family HTH domain
MLKNKTSDAIEIMDRRYREQIPNWDEEVAEEEMRVRVGLAILQLRQTAHLTQQEFAKTMGITQSMLSQLENGDYEGGSLDMLWRACKALHIGLDFSCRSRGGEEEAVELRLRNRLRHWQRS